MKLSFPSAVVQIKASYDGQSVDIRFPKDEGFLVKEIFEQNEYNILPHRSHSEPLQIFDIGANVGLFAVYMKMRYPESNIYCFEPAPDSMALCQVNTRPFKGITFHPYGLYNREKEEILHLHPNNTGMNSIKIYSEENTNTTSIRLKDAGTEFDQMGIKHLDVLKIDTEGCEIEILESFGHRLADIDYVLVEYHSEPDRRHIDQILKDFHVYNSRAIILGLGTVSYINSRLLEKSQ